MFIAEEEGLKKRKIKIKIKIKLQKDVEIFFLNFQKVSSFYLLFSTKVGNVVYPGGHTTPPPPPLGKVNWP